MKRRTLILLFILLLILMPSGAALAQSETTVVSSGETVEDVVLFEGDLVVEDGGTVSGDVTIFDGDATIAGTVLGDVMLFDGELEVAETAVLKGECAVLSGEVTDFTAVGLSCTNLSELAPELSGLLDSIPAIPAIPAMPVAPNAPPPPSFEIEEASGAGHFFGSVVGAIFSSLLLGVIAFGVATLFPQHLNQVSNTAREKPVASGTVGFLTGLALPFLMLLLSPILFVLAFVCGLGVLLGMALALGFAAALFLGWLAVGGLLGQRMAGWLHRPNWSVPMTTAVGTATLTFALGLWGAIPFVFGEGLVTFIITCIGLGAVALTKFGTRPYPVLDEGIRILMPENNEKVTAVLNTLPDDRNSYK